MKYLLIISLVCIILGALLAFLLLLRKSKNRKRLTILFIIIFVFVGIFYGYGFYKVNSETMKDAQTIDKKANLLLKYNMLKDDNVFTAYPNREGSTRYYYSIDGKLSNIFVDIEENEDGIVALRGNLDELDVNKLKQSLPNKVKYLLAKKNINLYIIDAYSLNEVWQGAYS